MRRLTSNELEQIRLDIIESSAWVIAELSACSKKTKKSEHGMGDGTANQLKSNLL
ncbi:hypothetical protein [Photobacterium damselae]|uniref:hypothetical protein n=1 Tax=Photobacterium damselae TaxID=38293 RepID=UPI00177DE333|nr:hypothetical protein [Photobacterium damselae]